MKKEIEIKINLDESVDKIIYHITKEGFNQSEVVGYLSYLLNNEIISMGKPKTKEQEKEDDI